MRTIRKIFMAAICAAVVAGFAMPPAALAKEKVRVGTAVSWPGYAFFELARQKNMAPDYDISVVVINDPLAGYAMLAADQLDILVSTLEYSPVAVEQGVPIVQTSYTNTSYGVDHVVLKPGIEPKDLKGGRVSAPIAFIGHLLMGVWLDRVGISPDDVEWVDMNADEAAGAMLAGDIDAGYLYEPWSTSIQQNLPGSRVITTTLDPFYLKDAMFADSVYMSKKFIAERREAAVDMMQTLFDARAYWSHHVDEVNPIMAEFLGWPVEDVGYVVGTNGKSIEGGLYLYDFDEAARLCGVLEGAPPFGQKNGGLVDTIAETNAWWIKLGLMKTTIDPNDALDCSILGDLVKRGYRSSFSANE